MKLAESLEAFKKVENVEEWDKWLGEYHKKHNNVDLHGNFFMDRYSVYDFTRSNDEYAGIEQLVAFNEYDEYYVLKDEYC